MLDIAKMETLLSEYIQAETLADFRYLSTFTTEIQRLSLNEKQELLRVLVCSDANKSRNPNALSTLLKIIDLLLRQPGVNINARYGDEHTTLLHAVADFGYVTMADELSARGANIDASDTTGATALHVAVSQGHTAMVRFLHSKGALVDVVDGNEKTPLKLALAKGHVAMLNFFLKDTDTPEKKRFVVQALMQRIGSLRDARDDDGLVELFAFLSRYSARSPENFKLVKEGLQRGPLEPESFIDCIYGERGFNVLQWAVSNGLTTITRLLLQCSADPDAPCREERPLLLAVTQRQPEMVALLLEYGAIIDFEVLQATTEQTNTAILELLIENGADVNAMDSEKNTLLHEAVTAGKVARVELLLQNGANPNAVNMYGRNTPLHEAVNLEKTDVAALLVRYGADVAAVNSGNNTPLSLARRRDYADISALLEARTANDAFMPAEQTVRTPDPLRNTPLHEAAARGDTAVCEVLIRERKANVGVRNTKKETPLHLAASAGHVEICAALIAAGADVATEDKFGRNALRMAAAGGQTEVCRLLLAHGADGRIRMVEHLARIMNPSKEVSNQTALELAAENGHTETCRLLLTQAGPIEPLLLQKSLYYATQKGYVDTCELFVKMLLQNQIDINDVNPQIGFLHLEGGYLHIAATMGNFPLVRLFLQNGCHINAADHFQRAPLHVAILKKHAEVALLLIEGGADLTLTDKDGWTPLHCADHRGMTEIIAAILRQSEAPPSIAGNSQAFFQRPSLPAASAGPSESPAAPDMPFRSSRDVPRSK